MNRSGISTKPENAANSLPFRNPGHSRLPPAGAGIRPSADRSEHRSEFSFWSAPLNGLSKPDRELFELFGRGPRIAPRHRLVHRGFEHFAAVQPEAIAIERGSESITYGALEAQANRLARLLIKCGVRRGDAVALFLERSIPMVVGILATLKTGAAYVPQHVGVAPTRTLRHISAVTDAKVVLTLSHLEDQVPVEAGQVCLCIDDIMAGDPGAEGATLALSGEPQADDDRCFILFTSGTTGVPNGVQVTHRNVCNILLTAPGDLGIRPGTRVGQILSIAFDMAAWEILGCLSNGGTLVLRGKDFQAVAEQVDVIISTPSILCAIDAGRCRNVKAVAVAGEPCPRPLADTWSEFCAFYNSCGPTETTIVNTAERHFPDKPTLSIGRPTPNNTVYILDENLRPCAIGEVGEMWAGGDCVTTGYLANETLTADRYRRDPFLGGNRFMFRTRDLGRWTPDGELEHFGRVDDQVKIRGFRVELDCVSSALEAVAGCEQAVTLKYDNRNLVSFVSPGTVDAGRARESVARQQPYYCVPSLIVPIDELPRTQRGKIDKRLLLTMAREIQERTGAEMA